MNSQPQSQGGGPTPEELQRLGNLYFGGKMTETERFARRLLNNHPEMVGLMDVLALALVGQGKYREAETVCREALVRQPKHADAHCNLGIALQNLGRTEEAAASYRRAIELNPKLPQAHNNLGAALLELGQAEEALASSRRAIALQSNHAEAYNTQGMAQRRLGKHDGAAASFREAVRINPRFAKAHTNLGNALTALGRLEEAEACHRRALELAPSLIEAHTNLGLTLHKAGRLDEAEALQRQALSLDPDYARAHGNLGVILHDAGRLEEAIESYEQALSIRPGNTEVLRDLAVALQDAGRMEEAVARYEQVLEIEPDNANVLRILAASRKHTERDGEVSRIQALYDDAPAMSGQKMHLGFALGKIFEDLEDYDQAFEYLAEANRVARSSLTYDPVRTADGFGRLQTLFDPGFVAKGPAGPSDGPVPVFIVGMPRSGTTLVEQILASHPEVAGAGELNYLFAAIEKETSDGRHPYPDGVDDIDDAALARIGARYLERLAGLADGHPYVTDKMPHNFFHVGIIARALPSARVIHVRREPMDTCLSIFAQYFPRQHPYGYDLEELGSYYRHYEALMAHWREAAPDSMLEVPYESLVSDPESQIRRLLDYCGLAFDPACLDFHKTERPVRTASAWQVREPLYATSIERWRRFEKHLEPLRAALEG